MHDVMKYYGDNKPSWNPSPRTTRVYNCSALQVPTVGTIGGVFDDVLSISQCQDLIEQFDLVEKYPVGVDGYCNDAEHAGSFRAMAWAEDFVEQMNSALRYVPQELRGSHGFIDYDRGILEAPFRERRVYRQLGSTPWMRFMRYSSGGMHVPHYDAPYHNEAERYITLFSWVLYLNDVPNDQGGAFQFVDNGFGDSHVRELYEKGALGDWRRMAYRHEIINSIQPRAGRLLVFPHWLCHQVQAFTASDQVPYRTMIRGDLAYGY